MKCKHRRIDWLMNVSCDECKKSNEYRNFINSSLDICTECPHQKAVDEMTEKAQVLTDKVNKLRNIVTELLESADYWSEYDVPIGIVDRMKKALKETGGRE